MLDYIKRVFKNYWVLSIFCIVLGIALIINPQFFTNAIGYIVGGFFAVYGILELVKYFAKYGDRSDYSTGLVKGIILCAVGVFIIVKPDFIPKVVAVLCGIYMLVSGLVNLQDSLNIKRAGIEKWQGYCIFSVLTVLLGLVLVFNPMAPVDAAMIILGIALLAAGIINVIGCFRINGKVKSINKIFKQAEQNNDDKFIDI